MLLNRIFYFDAAHFLPGYQGKCGKLHGHTYKLEVSIEGKMAESGMILDFSSLSQIVQERVSDILDHNLLNDFMPNPTCEKIAFFIWEKLASKLNLYSLKLWEGKNNSVTLYHSDLDTAL